MDKKTLIAVVAVCAIVFFALGAGMFFIIDSVTGGGGATADEAVTTAAVTSSVPATDTQPASTQAQTTATEKPTEAKKEQKVTPYVGRYYDSTNTSYIDVTSVGDNSFTFNGFWYRAMDMENVTAAYSGERAYFDYAPYDVNEVKGYIELTDKNTILFVVQWSATPLMEQGNKVFKYQSQEDMNAAQTEKYIDYLTMWDKNTGWVRGKNVYHNYPSTSFMRFYSDGTMKYRTTTQGEHGESVFYDETATYRVETTGNRKSVLYIGNDAYDITDMYAGGVLTMTISAKNVGNTVLNGSYEMAAHDVFVNVWTD